MGDSANSTKKRKLTKEAKILFLGLGIILTLMVIGAILSQNKNTIKPNDPGLIGNTAGNLINSGVFCESDGYVYFANSFDNGCLYRMTVDEQNLEKLNSSRVCNLLAGGDYLYYFQLGVSGSTGLGGLRTPHSFIRCKKDGSAGISMVREVIVSGQLVGNNLYLLGQDETPYFFRLSTDRETRDDITPSILYPSCATQDAIYYAGTVNDHYLYSMDTTTLESKLLLDRNIWFPIIDGDYLYYLDLENNYQLCRYSFSTGLAQVLCEDRVEGYNVGYGYIYYQTVGDYPSFVCMKTDGSDPVVLSHGSYCDISITSRYVYFKDYTNKTITLHSPLGSGSYSVFSVARDGIK